MKFSHAIGALIVASSVSTAAFAMPVGRAQPAEGALVSKVATYECVRDERGWHYMRGPRRVTCRPVRPKGTFWMWRCEGPRCGWWHRNEHRWNG